MRFAGLTGSAALAAERVRTANDSNTVNSARKLPHPLCFSQGLHLFELSERYVSPVMAVVEPVVDW